MKQQKLPIIAAIIGIIAVGVTITYFVPVQNDVNIITTTQEDQEKNDALGVAQEFILASPTFAFDGDINTLKTEYAGSTKSIPSQHIFKAIFDSSHGGFGNRDGQMLTQVITPHKVNVIVSKGIVISAVTDETWDELNQQYVLKTPQSKLPSTDKPIKSFEGMATDYFSLVDAIKSRGVLIDHIDEIASENSSLSVPTKAISIGGSDVQVFEFANESDAKKARLTISKDGTEIGTSIIRWIDTPHFYTNGKLVVLYVGHNPEIANLLESFLGKQFAGMELVRQTMTDSENSQNDLVIENASFLPGSTSGGMIPIEGKNLTIEIQSSPIDALLHVSLKNNDGSYTWEGEVKGNQTITINDIKDEFLDLKIQNNSEKSVSLKAVIRNGHTSTIVDQIKEEEAINLIKKQYPQLQDFPSDGLPPKIIRTEKSTEGWYVTFETQGSGIPIIEAQCFLVDYSKAIIQIGDYRPDMGDMKTNISIKTCS